MNRIILSAAAAVLLAVAFATHAQAPARPQIATTKVDALPVGQVAGRGMIDFHPLEAEAFIKQVIALDRERLIPGHPGPNDRLGTKQDAQDQLTFLQDASAEIKMLAQDGKCWEPAEKEFKLPKYESWPGYANNLQFVARRYCALWGRGT